jgi:hypothetical protein
VLCSQDDQQLLVQGHANSQMLSGLASRRAVACGASRAGRAADCLAIAKVVDRAAAGRDRACARGEGDSTDWAADTCGRANLHSGSIRQLEDPAQPAAPRHPGLSASARDQQASACRLHGFWPDSCQSCLT